jgi:hypothetical protein
MKKVSLFFALTAVIFSTSSCQKDDPESPAPAIVETWLLLDQDWTATLTPNGSGSDLVLTKGQASYAGQTIPVASLPAAVIQKMSANGNPVPSDATVWQISSGGYIIQFTAVGQEKNLFWFDGSDKLLTIGRVRA